MLWLGLSLRHGTFYTFDFSERWLEALLVLSGPVMTVSAFGWFGLYRLVTRFIGPLGFTRIVSCVGISVLLWALMVFMAGQHGVPRSVIVFYFFAASVAIVSTRQAMGWVLRSAGLLARTPVSARRPVLIPDFEE